MEKQQKKNSLLDNIISDNFKNFVIENYQNYLQNYNNDKLNDILNDIIKYIYNIIIFFIIKNKLDYKNDLNTIKNYFSNIENKMHIDNFFL